MNAKRYSDLRRVLAYQELLKEYGVHRDDTIDRPGLALIRAIVWGDSPTEKEKQNAQGHQGPLLRAER